MCNYNVHVLNVLTLGFAAVLHSSASIDWRTKCLRLELLVTAAIDWVFPPLTVHAVDTVEHVLLNIQSPKCSENSDGYMPSVKGCGNKKVQRVGFRLRSAGERGWAREKRSGHCLYLSHPSLWAINKHDLSSRLQSIIFVITSEKVPTRSKHATGKACVYQTELALKLWVAVSRGPIHMSPPLPSEHLIMKSSRSLYSSWSCPSIQSCGALQPLDFFFFFFPLPQLVVALGWTAAYLPNTILERGETVWCKNLMKATNLCEWLRGITLVRREKNELKMLTFSFFFFFFGRGGQVLNLCKQSKKFMRDDQSWPLFDHP